ncbi:MAG: T9SS type A sorting domain-containing protein [Chitinophagaceae bacterium]|nr:T9SS type A sorting domain-containing protein [Chitinophagaceae bacterium]
MNYYDVERSIDGINFIKVVNVTAINASVATSIISNSIYDDVLNIGSTIVYYRLKMIEKSGKYKFSNVLNFKLNSKGKVGIVVHPNPAVSFFNLKIGVVKDAVATTRIMDLSGRIMVTQTSKVAIGTNVFAFNNLSNFSAGTYNVQIMIDRELYNEKSIVAK